MNKKVKNKLKSKIKNIYGETILFIKEEYKFLISCLLILILFFYPVNYYIVIGGGISDIGKRIEIENALHEQLRHDLDVYKDDEEQSSQCETI